MATLVVFIISIVEIFFAFGGISVLVLGQSVPTLFKREKPFRHLLSMYDAIFQIAPWKTINRTAIALIIGFGIFTILIDTVQKDGTISFGGFPFLTVLGCYNFILLVISIITILISKKKRNKEKDWATVRMKAHYKVYACYPTATEYATW